MTPDPSIPSIADVLEAYALEAQNDAATLARYLREFPRYTAELVEYSRELDRTVDASTAPLGAADQARIDAGWQKLSSAAKAASVTPLSRLNPAKTRAMAQALKIPQQVLSALREHRVILESIPRLFQEHLAELLDIPYDELHSSLARAPNLAGIRSYKSTQKPIQRPQITFEQLLIEACVPEDQRALLLAEKK